MQYATFKWIKFDTFKLRVQSKFSNASSVQSFKMRVQSNVWFNQSNQSNIRQKLDSWFKHAPNLLNYILPTTPQFFATWHVHNKPVFFSVASAVVDNEERQLRTAEFVVLTSLQSRNVVISIPFRPSSKNCSLLHHLRDIRKQYGDGWG